MKTYNDYGYPDVDALRKLLNPSWHKRLRASIDSVAVIVWCIGVPGYLAGLIEVYFHRHAIITWFQRLGYWQWVILLIFLAAAVLFGHWLYTKGVHDGSDTSR